MKTYLQAAILFLLAFLVFLPVYPSLVGTWLNHSDNSHGILVPFITLYLVWTNKSKFDKEQVETSQWGLGLLVAALTLYFVAFVGEIAFVMRFMLVVSVNALVLYVFGRHIYRSLAFPLLFLFFMIPIPVSILTLISFPLQLFATKISASLIQFCSIPVWREGTMLYFVNTQLEVAEACSGIRSIMSMTMLSVLFVYFMHGSRLKKGILLASAIPIAVVANIVRVSGTGILAHFFGDVVARGFLHEFSGMAVFAFGIVVFLLESWLLNKLFNRSARLNG